MVAMMTWIYLGTGFTGAWTLWFVGRAALRRLGRIQSTIAYFSPKGGCLTAIVKEIKAAKSEILVQAYSFTADPLTHGLIDAKKRGVNVEILLDKSHEVEPHSDLRIFLEQGLPPLIDGEHAIAHNKLMVIDRHTVITGSFNFTNQAETKNAENVIIIKGNAELVQAYRQNFLAHKLHSRPAELKAQVVDPRQLPRKVA